MNGKTMLYIDQYGLHIFARTIKELCEKSGGGRIFKIYVDLETGGTRHVGYGIGNRWFNAYQPMEIAA